MAPGGSTVDDDAARELSNSGQTLSSVKSTPVFLRHSSGMSGLGAAPLATPDEPREIAKEAATAP